MVKTQQFLRKVNTFFSIGYRIYKKITWKRYWRKILLLAGIFVFITLTVVQLQYPKEAIAISSYYVAANGSDSNSGTQQYPFATIAYAVKLAQPGDTIYIRGGTYYPTKEIWIGNQGTASAPIVFQSYSGETAIIDGSKLPTNKAAIAIGGEYIQIKNLEIINTPSTGLTVWGGNHIKLLNNVVHDINGTGIYVGHDNLKQVTDILIQGNMVYHTNLKNSSHDDFGGSWGNGITASGSDHIQVIDNQVYENHGEGIGLWGSDILISGNTVYDNYSVEIYLDGVGNATVQRNLIYTTNNSTYYRFGHPAVGIQVANEGGKYQLQNNKIINNIVIGGGWGFYYGNYKSGGGMKNMLIANNTFYQGTRGLINID